MLEDLHSPLQHKEISRYHFYDLPVPNVMVKSENWASLSVLQYFLAPIRHRRWWCWSGTMWGYKWRVPGLQTVDTLVWKAGPILIAATACAGSFPAFRPQLSTALITIDHCKSSSIDNIQRWCLAIILFIYTQVVSSLHSDGRFCSQVYDSRSILKVHCNCFF